MTLVSIDRMQLDMEGNHNSILDNNNIEGTL